MFIFVALDHFEDSEDGKLGVLFHDNIGFPIPTSLFEKILKTFGNGSDFFVELRVSKACLENDDGDMSALTSQVRIFFILSFLTEVVFFFIIKDLKKYFMDKNLDHYLKQYSIEGGNPEEVVDAIRRSIVNHIVDLMVKGYGLYPTKFQRVSTAKASVKLFPALRYKESTIGGIVRFIIHQLYKT